MASSRTVPKAVLRWIRDKRADPTYSSVDSFKDVILRSGARKNLGWGTHTNPTRPHLPRFFASLRMTRRNQQNDMKEPS